MGAERCDLMTWQSLELVHGRTVGRVCIIDHGYPLAIPINYRVTDDDGEIRFIVRTAPDTLIGRYEGPASIEVDEIDLENGSAWSVIARGAMKRLIGTHEYLDPNPLVTEGRHTWLELSVLSISGRRFTVSTESDGYTVDWELAAPEVARANE
ncbi:MAG: pyridoxamine 5'-phosphate oxidase family protein [Ilumatobacteraceae bacterium]